MTNLTKSQCARMDLNKKSDPKQKTTTGWKGTPLGFKKTTNENDPPRDPITKNSKNCLGY